MHDITPPLPATHGVRRITVEGKPSTSIARQSPHTSVGGLLSSEHANVLSSLVVTNVDSRVSIESKSDKGVTVTNIPSFDFSSPTLVNVLRDNSVGSKPVSQESKSKPQELFPEVPNPDEAFNPDTNVYPDDPPYEGHTSDDDLNSDWGKYSSDEEDSSPDFPTYCTPCVQIKKPSTCVSNPSDVSRILNIEEVKQLDECPKTGPTERKTAPEIVAVESVPSDDFRWGL